MRNKCYLCGSENIEHLKGKVRDNNKLHMLKCNDCSLAFLDDFDHISDHYYIEGKMLPKNFDISVWEKNAYHDDYRRYNLLKDKIINKIVIDFGAGAGGFLKLAKHFAKDVYALELDINLINYIKNQGINVYDDIKYCPKADIITMFHVLEHIKDPISLLSDLKKHLNGLNSQIIIEVPNLNDSLISLYKSKNFLDFTWWSCHLYSYNRNTLQKIIKKAGYKINYIKNIQRYGLINHIHWLKSGMPNGHIIHPKLNNVFINYVYSKFLSALNKTDTIFVSISPV